MEAGTVSITLWGDGLVKEKWLEWYEEVGNIFRILGYDRTHLAIDCQSFPNKKIVTTARKEKQIVDILRNGELPQSMSCYSLMKEYNVAMFDYDMIAVRHREYLSLIINRSDLQKLDLDSVLSSFKQFIEFEYGEVYQMDRKEMPLMYAAKARTINQFKSLVVIKRF